MVINNDVWLNNNSIAKNESYVQLLLQDNQFKYYNIVADGYGDSCLIINHGLEDYKVEIDKDTACFKIFMRNKANNFKQKEKYRFIKNFMCEDIEEVLRYIKDKCCKKCNLVC